MMKNYLIVMIVSVTALLLQACQEASVRVTPANAEEDGVMQSGQRIAVGHETNCRGRVALKPHRYHSISARDKRRFVYDYINNINKSIQTQWRKPSNLAGGENCVVQIKQRVDGCVQKVIFKNCTHPQMRASVRRAIALASPLPIAPHPDVYDDTIQLKFTN